MNQRARINFQQNDKEYQEKTNAKAIKFVLLCSLREIETFQARRSVTDSKLRLNDI